MNPHAPEQTPRQRWLAVIARASASELADTIDRHGGAPGHTILKAALTGTAMIEARAGGTGQRFNAGEATVTRCVVRLDSGPIGVCYVLGTDRERAHLGALLDGRLQERHSECALWEEIGMLAARQAAARDVASRKAAATKVEFFTLVRGDG